MRYLWSVLLLATSLAAFEDIGYSLHVGGYHSSHTVEDPKTFSLEGDMHWSVDPMRRFAFGFVMGAMAYDHHEGAFENLGFSEMQFRLSPFRNNPRYLGNQDFIVGAGYYHGQNRDETSQYGFGVKGEWIHALNNKYGLSLSYRYIPLDNGPVIHTFWIGLHVVPDSFIKSNMMWHSY